MRQLLIKISIVICFAILLAGILCITVRAQAVHHDTKGNIVSIDTNLSTQVFTQMILGGGFYCNPHFDSLKSFTIVNGVLYLKTARVAGWDTVKGYTTPPDSTIFVTKSRLSDSLFAYLPKWMAQSLYLQKSDSLIYTSRHKFDSTISSLTLGGGVSLAQLNDSLVLYTPLWMKVANLSSPSNVTIPTTLAVLSGINSAVLLDVKYSDSNTIYQTKYRSDSQRSNLYSYISTKGTVQSVAAGAGLSGGVFTTSGTVSMPNVGTSGTYGGNQFYTTITTDAQGRVSGIVTGTATISYSNVLGAPSTTAGGDLTGTYPSPSIATGVITNAKVASGAGIVYSKLNLTASIQPTVDLVYTGTPSASTFLRGDGSWSTPVAGSGSVTTFSSSNMSPIFTTSVSNASTTPSVTYILTSTSSHTILGNHTGSSAVPTYGLVDLTSEITGNLPIANLGSGTGANSATFWRGDGTWVTPTNTTYTAGRGLGLSSTSFYVDTTIIQKVIADTTISAAYTLTLRDAGRSLHCTNSSNIALTVPTGLGTSFRCEVIQESAGTVTPTASSTTLTFVPTGTTKSGGVGSIFLIRSWATSNSFTIQGQLQ